MTTPNCFADAPDLEAVIAQAVGAASMCWQHPERAGEYNTEEAFKVAADAVARIRELIADPRQHAYGSCPTQVTGNTLDGVPFYFRARYGRWELWAPYTSTEEVLVASGEDETYGSMHADDVDKIIDAHLGTGWTNGGVR